jgi:hypothetical protein
MTEITAEVLQAEERRRVGLVVAEAAIDEGLAADVNAAVLCSQLVGAAHRFPP